MTRSGRRPAAGRGPESICCPGVARCGECGAKLAVKKTPANHQRSRFKDSYACRERACVGIAMDLLDEYVEAVMVRWMSDPHVAANMTRVDDSPAAAMARADLELFRAKLDELYRAVRAGRTSAMLATQEEAGLLERIRDAEQQIEAATLAPVLRGKFGPWAAAKWKASPLEVKRAAIRATADIRVEAVGRHGNKAVPPQDRVTWRWLVGSDAELVT